MKNFLSDGIFIAVAVSITLFISDWETSFSLIATIPVELKLRIWPPAIPVQTVLILYPAISSASSIDFIDSTVASILLIEAAP